MIVRPSWCSTVAPSRFIDTSHSPIPSMARKSAGIVAGIECATPAARPVRTRQVSVSAEPAKTVRAAPYRLASRPANGSPTSDPADPTSMTSPSWPGVTPRSSRTVGMRPAHVANVHPLRAKTRLVATLAASSRSVAWPVWPVWPVRLVSTVAILSPFTGNLRDCDSNRFDSNRFDIMPQ